MKLEIEFGGKARRVEIEGDPARGRQIRCTIDGRTIEADAAEVAPGIYSILIGGTSLEARVEAHGGALRVVVAGREYAAAVRDPRQWRRSRGAALEAEGRQHVTAPMPGKIVRVLVKAGEAVEAGQGILVVEAMKMQNEVRSPKSGTVERLLVSENQAVGAGDVLAIVA
ncbi:MAG: biotin/lipoyl-containing protein [Candidatus Acidiferrales bacterium]